MSARTKPRNVDIRYADTTMSDLVVRNYLRLHPVSFSELALYAGHKSVSLRVTAGRLRREGRLTKQNIVVRDHPDNAQLEPLDDLSLPAPSGGAAGAAHAKATALAIVQQALGEQVSKRLTMDELISLTDEYIRSGAGGKDFLNAVRARIDLEGIAPPALGPPPPTTLTLCVDRLHDLIVELPTAVIEAAVARRLLTLQSREALSAPRPDDAPLPEPPA